MDTALMPASRSDDPGLLQASRGTRILILSAKFGGGHRSTAEALRDWWERSVPEGQAKVIDYFDEFVSPVTSGAASVGYTQSVRLFPVAYRLFYDATAELKPDSPAQQWLNNLGRRELEAYLAGGSWDLIVAVHPTPAGALSELRRAGVLDRPAVTVVTDYVVHSQWLHPGTDLYLVGSDPVREGLIARGVAPEKVFATGIPIRTNTALLEQREALREKWGLQPGLPTVMVMTGAQGMLRRPARLFHTVASRPVQGFFLCGKDRALFSRLKLWGDKYPNFRVMPFVRVVPELMCVSDVLVTKAGGLTTSEALAMELPMIIFHPIPGQEYANRDYLAGVGAALSAEDLRELGAVLDDVCRRPEQLDRMRESIRRVRRPDAAAAAGMEMLRLLREERRWTTQ